MSEACPDIAVIRVTSPESGIAAIRVTNPEPKIRTIRVNEGIKGDKGDPGPQGPPGQSYARRFEAVGNTSYSGRAAPDTDESATAWTIKRSIFSNVGNLVSSATATAVAWTDRLTAIYT